MGFCHDPQIVSKLYEFPPLSTKEISKNVGDHTVAVSINLGSQWVSIVFNRRKKHTVFLGTCNIRWTFWQGKC